MTVLTRKLYILLSTIILIACSFNLASAQQTPQAPLLSVSEIDTRITNLKDNSELTEEQIKAATELYQEAKRRLEASVAAKEQKVQFESELANAPKTLQTLEAEIQIANQALAETSKEDEALSTESMRQEDLLALEQELVQKESELRTIRAELEGYRDSLQAITNRQTNAPRELVDARAELAKITAALSEFSADSEDVVGAARQANLRIRNNYRRLQIAALELEIAGQSNRLEIMTARQNLADLKARALSLEVQAMQELTGQRRLNEALQLQESVKVQSELYAGQHPILTNISEQNVQLAEQARLLASTKANISRNTATTRSRHDQVLEDLNVAKQLSRLESLDRNAGATLRRLGNQLESVPSIRSSVKQTQSELIDATRQRLIALEALRDLPIGRVDPQQILKRARQADATIADFTPEDITALESLYNSKRILLRRIQTEGLARVSDLETLQKAQKDYLGATEELQSLLDEKLLWIPSVPAIGLDWAPKIVKGSLELFSAEHLTLMTNTLITQLSRFWPLVLVFGVIILVLYRSRTGLVEEIRERAKKVGRVQQDSAWHTPTVIGIGFLIAAPLPLFLLLLGGLMALVEVPDPFIEGLEDAFFFVALLSFIFLTWRAWDREKSLFSAHFKMPNDLRKAVNKELRWFIPVMGVSSGLLALTTDMDTTDIYEGFSLFVFIFTALTLAFFGFKVIWWDRKLVKAQTDEGFLSRHRLLVSAIMIAGPIAAAGVAAAGYYETADELLWRFFTSSVLLLMTYIVWGTIRRMIVVAQRQLKYRQALERRDAAIKARREKEAAEERGEEVAPPPLDTKEIDVSTLTRQSSQLLNTIIIIAFTVFMWMNWSSLVPALSIFDSIEVWTINTGDIDAATQQPIELPITMWNILQSLFILGLTFISARNLPGFLEIFVLNKLGVNPGTRYAVVTILGYTIVAVGVIMGFNRMGFEWSQLKFVAAGLSVGIGFGLQKIIANFVSGLIILFERPIRIGDYVTIGEQSGTVSRIKIRATTLSDLDNREILIPNEALISERVTNWTLSNSVTRLVVSVGIAYGSDTEKARTLILDTVKALPKVLETPAPQVLFMGFGDSSLNFQIRVFLRAFDDRVPMTHTIHTEVNKTLAKAGISIPFPQVDLNIVSQNIPLQIASQQMAKSKPRATAKAKPKSKPETKPSK
ncbi:potassium efflux system protein [Litorimonas taeanensis]|uniref:Potassium efflux system protein n=1 Tax=Litorimonas taeanensis TaxID=568099 RepID=A0A420WLE6_9PROT|nr:mechanosensitive ion channel domain-containing protein [Litorimonas taeanensis]RKQ71799.1 potassium efflux system protein [Litorimonas taeanensis]